MSEVHSEIFVKNIHPSYNIMFSVGKDSKKRRKISELGALVKILFLSSKFVFVSHLLYLLYAVERL